jgi:uncharacterized protein (DUF433 family)
MDTEYDNYPYHDRIAANRDVMVGKPVVKGTRITVEAVLEFLAGSYNLEELYEAYPRLTREDLTACLLYARDAVHREWQSSPQANRDALAKA